MKYMKLYGSTPRTEHSDVHHLRRRIERYRRALRRCGRRVKRERELRAAATKAVLFLNERAGGLRGLRGRRR
jgi:hypothetical protein